MSKTPKPASGLKDKVRETRAHVCKICDSWVDWERGEGFFCDNCSEVKDGCIFPIPEKNVTSRVVSRRIYVEDLRFHVEELKKEIEKEIKLLESMWQDAKTTGEAFYSVSELRRNKEFLILIDRHLKCWDDTTDKEDDGK